MYDIGFRKMKLFLSVIEEGSFTKASNKNNISQPAATICINSIEEAFGMALFERKGCVRQPVLTSEGSEIAVGFGKLLAMYNGMFAHLSNTRKKRERGSLFIEESSLHLLSSEWYKDSADGDMAFDIKVFSKNEIIQSVIDKKTYLGLVSGFVDDTIFDYMKIGQGVFCLVSASSVYTNNFVNSGITWKEINAVGRANNIYWLDIDKASSTRIERLLKEVGGGRLGGSGINSMFLMSQMLARRDIDVIMPLMNAQKLNLNRHFKILPIKDPFVSFDIGLISHKGHMNMVKTMNLAKRLFDCDLSYPMISVARDNCLHGT